MIELQPVNVRLTRSQYRQLMSWLKRAAHLGRQLGDFVMRITVRRVGRQYRVNASVHDSVGDFRLEQRNCDCRTALRELARRIAVRLHDQRLARVTVAA